MESTINLSNLVSQQKTSPVKRINLEEYRARKKKNIYKEEKSEANEAVGRENCTALKLLLAQKENPSHAAINEEMKNSNHEEEEDFLPDLLPVCERSPPSLQKETEEGQMASVAQTNLIEGPCKFCGLANPLSPCTCCLSQKNSLPIDQEDSGLTNSALLTKVMMKIKELERKKSSQQQPSISKETFYGDKKSFKEQSPTWDEDQCEEKSLDEPVVLTIHSDDEEEEDSTPLSNTHHSLVSFKEPRWKRHRGISQDNFLFGGGRSTDKEEPVSSDDEQLEDFVKVECKHVFVGSYRSVPAKRITLTKGCFTITLPTLVQGQPPVKLELKMRGIMKILAHLDDDFSYFFIYAKPSLATYVSRLLRMSSCPDVCLNPLSKDETIKRITIIAKSIPASLRAGVLSYYRCKDEVEGARTVNPFEYLSLEEANAILVKACPSLEFDSTPQKSCSRIFSESLFTYPPPPNKGGITVTTNDYYCLEEEQFLNDVIIDFYLKWLLLSQVSVEDRERTHVFSTFFYKRLTSKPKKARRTLSAEDDPSLTPAQKRHARVKSWTKNVDIFDKDFIVIPINEHSHWFLAVVCFPGLDGPVRMSDGRPMPTTKEAREGVRSKGGGIPPPTKPPRKIKIETPLIEDVEWSDRDEAEGDEDELEEDGEDDAQQPPHKKIKTDDESEMTSQSIHERDQTVEDTSCAIKRPCILIFDSLPGRSRAGIIATLRDYLTVEYDYRRGVSKVFSRDTMKGACPKVPRQMNFSDCGLFTLQFAQLFFRQPLKDFRFPIRTLGHWFTQDVVRCKRESIAKLIGSLMDQYRPGHGITLPQIHFNSLGKVPPQPLFKTQEEEDEDMSKTCSGALSPSPPQAPDSIPCPGSPKRIKIKLCERAALPPRPKSPMPFLETSDSSLVISDDDSGNHSDVDNNLQSFSSTSKCSIYQKKYSTISSSSSSCSSSSLFSCNSAFKPTSAAARSYPVSNSCSETSEREPFQFFLPDLSLSGVDESSSLSSDSQKNNKLRQTILSRKITR